MDGKQKQPKTLQEAIQYFSDYENCRQFMASVRWLDGVVRCPYCQSENVTYLSKARVYRCYGNHPKQKFSLKIGTVFEDSPIALGKWLLIGWMLANCRNGVSSYEVARTIGITQKSAWFMLHRLRTAAWDEPQEKLTGEVEADETYVGGRTKFMHASKIAKLPKKPSIHDKTPVMGILERGGTVRAMVVKNHKRPELHAEIRKHVEPGSILYTDDLHSYRGLPDYFHYYVDHLNKYVHGRIHTNGLENFWSCLKRSLKGTYIAVQPQHLQGYVAEQVFRFNVRKKALYPEERRFSTLMEGTTGKRLTYAELINRE